LTFQILRSKPFDRDIRRLRRRFKGIERDLEELLPKRVGEAADTAGDRIPGTQPPMWKVRLPVPSERIGTRGGLRVIYSILHPHRAVVLLAVFSKNEMQDITLKVLQKARDEIREPLRQELSKRGMDPDIVRFLAPPSTRRTR
jgi:mRNA-degrading endonuclease RelE of RelBE toxin-antitoxin system